MTKVYTLTLPRFMGQKKFTDKLKARNMTEAAEIFGARLGVFFEEWEVPETWEPEELEQYIEEVVKND